jgi:hypothetical protein
VHPVQILRNAVSAVKLLANVCHAMMVIIYLMTAQFAQAAPRSRHSVNFVVAPQAAIIAIADTIWPQALPACHAQPWQTAVLVAKLPTLV